ncbi:MAG: thioesterase family protein [Acidimicrobiales bacterium]|nr:thioesterase family protein [Acidimicrobiales bacterium]
MRTVRHAVDMMRAVPLAPFRGEVELIQSDRRIQVVRVSMIDMKGWEVARSTSLRMRVSEVANPLDPERTAHEEDVPHLMPTEPVDFTVFGVGVQEFLKAVKFHEEGDYRAGAPGLLWLRMHNTVCTGYETSRFVCLATLSDMASMAAQYLDSERWMTVNADLTVSAFRDPVGDWIGIWGLHKNVGDGIGLSKAVLYDLDGRVGRAAASILISHR